MLNSFAQGRTDEVFTFMLRLTGDPESARARGAIFTAGGVGLFLAVFFVLAPSYGSQAAAASVLAVIPAGWYYGWRAGLLSALLASVLDAVLVWLVAGESWEGWIGGAGLPGTVSLVLVGAGAGVLRRLVDRAHGLGVERAKAQAALAREVFERTALAEIGRIMTSSVHLEDVYDPLATQVQKLIPFDRLTITEADFATGTLKEKYVSGADDRQRHTAYPMSGNVVGEAVRNGRNLIIVDDHSVLNPAALLPPSGWPSLLAVPLVVKGNVTGALCFESRRPQAYSPALMATAEQIAAQIAGAAAIARMHSELQTHAEQRRSLAEIGRVMSYSLKIEDVFARFAELLRGLVPCDRVAINTVDPVSGMYTERYIDGLSIDGRDPGSVVSMAGTITEQAVRIGSSVRVSADDAASQAAVLMKFPGLAPAFRAGLRSFVCVPLIWKESVIGTLHIRSVVPAAYSDLHVLLVQEVAAQVAGAIVNSDLHRAAEAEAEIRRALAAIAAAASRDLDVTRAMDSVSEDIAGLVPYEHISLSLIDQDTGALKVVFVRGSGARGAELGAKSHPSPGQRWQWRTVLETEAAGLSELRSLLEVPFGTEASGPIGYLLLRSREEGAYTERHLGLMKLVAAQLTPPIQSAIAHAQALKLGEERERAAELEAQTNDLQRVNEAKSQFLSTVSHELRTPLTSMIAFADILKRDKFKNLQPSQMQYVDVIQRNGKRLAVLIDDLLDLSRIETGRFEMQSSKFGAREMLAELAETFDPIAAERKQKLVVSLPQDDVDMVADKTRLSQIVLNLLTNASKYSPEGTEIEFSGVATAQELTVSVKDHGPGIPKADQEHLFTLFFRARNEATQKIPGSGIGLYVTKSIVELHGGSIWIESEEGSGTVVSFRVPLTAAWFKEESQAA